ncbi:MAG: 23S rRNA (adenine(2503)-C(2))-methyltransferase RlmN [Myxococcales bacterium]|nr:23S rRNA (adenine(2503)-C(2))-methyltransferase RlmN [Myxococcales bacterium]MCB9520708.1 23S rRNA (adenine(2503)-C(2))-methyltransferase RlmN [Myxococcales bacterium]MCB9532112.1 23S rRNA (adenine(2503)-C(2))-methyltransferase RlmN [Myxococcales bacterium]
MTHDRDGKLLLKSLTRSELEEWVASLGEKPYRAKQLWRWLYLQRVGSFDEMSDLSRDFRERAAAVARVDVLRCTGTHRASDGTRKLTWETLDGGQIESVLIPTETRNTLCISSQLGCAINCQFCLTAKMGLRGHLSTAEIVDQVVQTRRQFEDEQRISNIVFMGMGEPLHNPENVFPATRILTDSDGLNLSHRKVTVSTSGLVPEIRRLGVETRVRLAVSLNATTDEVRDWVMPINRRYPLAELMGTLRSFPLPKGERITFEYVMLDGVNDSDDDARRIVRLTAQIPCKINLIPFNPHPGTEFRPSPRERVERFRDLLLAKNLHTTIRETRGDDRMAACGQLGKPGPRMPKRADPPQRFRSVVAEAAEGPTSTDDSTR